MNPNLLHKITNKPFTKQHVKLLTHFEQLLFLVPATFSLFSFFANVICFFSTTQKSTPFFELYSGTQLVFEKTVADERKRTFSRP